MPHDGMRPPDNSAEGAALRMAEGLQNPGNPRRAVRMIVGLVVVVALVVLAGVLLS